MKQLNKKLENIVSNVIGKLIYIGNISDGVLSTLKKNNNIIYCDLLNASLNGEIGKTRKKSKSINLKDFKKFYKKKNLDYIICDLEDIKKYIPRFISTSIYICKGSICIYGSKDIYDLERLIKKYKRYNCDVNVTEYEKEFLIEIDVSRAKNKIIMDKLYYIYDLMGYVFDKISDLIIG